MKLMVTLVAFAIVTTFAITASRSAGPETEVSATPLRPYRYSVGIKLRETANGNSFELTSMSLPVIKEGTPAIMTLDSGDLSFTATATVKREQRTEVATVTISMTRAEKVIASPTIQVELGRTGRMQIGSAGNAIDLEIVPIGA